MTTIPAIADPIELARLLWPDVSFYREQQQIIRSIWKDDETYVVAANEMGKDYVAGRVALLFFITRHPCRVVTTSAKDDHLRVLWAEIYNAIQTCRYPLDRRKGGPLLIHHQDIRKYSRFARCPISYMIGMVANQDSIAAMQGHHVAQTGDGIPRTLFISDESSSVPQAYFTMARTWAKRMFVFGNAWPCNNDFKWAFKGNPATNKPGGDRPNPDKPGSNYRTTIRIKAEQSPNVRYAQAQLQRGLKPTGEQIIPGVKSWYDYVKDRREWDVIQQCVSLDADFYEGADVLMFPAEWLNAAEARAVALIGKPRIAKAIGCDPAEGGDKTTMAAVDEFGLIELVSKKTPDTAMIPRELIAFGRKHGVPPIRWMLDRGGGGKQHADQLRSQGYPVKTVAFGEGISLDPRRGLQMVEWRMDTKEEKYAYFNRRSEMYGDLRLFLNPGRQDANGNNLPVWAIPAHYVELRRQLSPIPLTYDREGRLKLLSKNRVGQSKERTLIDLIGCSPDEADAVVVAIHCMLRKRIKTKAGSIRSH
jgi:hypothetical protein